MEYDLDMRLEGDVLLVCLTGTRTRETVIAASRDIMEAWSQSSTTKHLIDVRRFPGRLHLADDYEVPAKEFAGLPYRDRLKASAVVDLAANHARFVLFEDVARSRGFNLRVFSDIDRAWKWLDEQG